MAWSKKQKTMAAMACKSAGVDEAQRRDVILRNFTNAHYKGGITSTSPKLTDADFEQFMAVVEGYAGGRLMTAEPGHWQRSAADRWQRMRHAILQLDAALQAAGRFTPDSLGKWITDKVKGGDAGRLEELDYHGLLTVMLGLRSFAEQKGVKPAPLTPDTGASA